MPIQLQSSGFYEQHDALHGVSSLGIDTDRIDACVSYYHEKGFRGLFGHSGFGFKQDNLNFLALTPNATHLWLWDVSIEDMGPLYLLQKLEYFGVNPLRPGIDFSRFPKMRTAVNHWIGADHGISESSITDYHLWHFKPRSKSFDGLELPLDVEELQLNWANPQGLHGLPVLNKLNSLEIHRCRNLADLSELPTIAPNLCKLIITTSKRVDTVGIVNHPNLQLAIIDGHRVVQNDG